MVRALLLLLLATDAQAGKRPPPAAAAPAATAELPPPLASVLTQPSPYAARGPALTGSTDTLDITTMRRAVLLFELGLPDLGLAGVGASELTVLRRTLAADPGWRLAGSPGQLIAVARRAEGGAWSSAASSYHEDQGTLSRVSVRFGPWPAADPWATSALVVRATPSTAKVKLAPATLQEAPWTGRKATALSVDGPGVGYDIFEAGLTDQRPATTAAVLELGELFQRTWATVDIVLSRGVDGMLLPAGEPGVAGALSLRSPGPGLVTLSARANPGEEGWTWLRLLVAGRPWEEQGVAAGTREVIGYSSTPAQGFYMESTFALPSGSALPATAELWFLPLSGVGTPRRLSVAEVVVPPR